MNGMLRRLLAAVTVVVWAAGASAQTELPRPEQPFAGKIGPTVAQSMPAFPKPVRAPEHAPNVLLILTDDVGFGAASTFGGPIPTPTLDKLAARGLKYNEFHTTAICSPTRAALLTGRNHHAVATGTLVDLASGYPGYCSIIPKSAATVATILRDNGYNTAFFGKHHNTPIWQTSAAGPFDRWPTGLGFEYFYGFIGGDTDQWAPALYRGTTRVETPHDDPTYILDRDLADDAIHWIHNQKAAGPDKPFFVYYAPGSAHAPHQAPKDWIARFRGQFDQGWDQVRKETYARQRAAGIIPEHAKLSSRPKEIPAWNELSADRKRIDARMMEVYAAMLSFQDAQIGRVLEELDRMGELDHTLLLFVEGDNGSSGEGGPEGTTNEIGHLANDVHDSDDWMLDRIDEMGGPHTYEIFPAGWAWAMDTPFPWFKQIGSHLGGMRNGLVVSWPDRIQNVGGMRSQFHHVVDILPTILDAASVETPKIVEGVAQQRVDGVSMTYSFGSADAPDRHTTQYFELHGNRAIYHDGWLANTTPQRMPWTVAKAPVPGAVAPESFPWELYDLKHDYSQAVDLASKAPERLKELHALFLKQAEANQVLPIHEPSAIDTTISIRKTYGTPRTQFLFWGKEVSVSRSAWPPIFGQSFRITASVTTRKGERDGVLVAAGSLFGGWSFYLEEGRPVAHEAVSQKPEDQFRVAAREAVPQGDATVRFEFKQDPGMPGSGGTLQIDINGEEVAQGRIDRTILLPAGIGETFDVGLDTGARVTDDYAGEGAFTGQIHKVVVEVTPPGAPEPHGGTQGVSAPDRPAGQEGAPLE